MTIRGKAYRADIYSPDKNCILDITCIQTTQNRRTLLTAMAAAYRRKVDNYNAMLRQGNFTDVFRREGTTIIPVVIGPRGQFFTRSWNDLMRFLGMENPQAAREETYGLAPVMKNEATPERSAIAISLLKTLSFHVAVDTAVNALKWQCDQRKHWSLTNAKNKKDDDHNGPQPDCE